MRRFISLTAVLFGITLMAFGAEDPNGSWTATIETPMGSQQTSFTFKMDGEKLTGSVVGMMGEVKISNGKLDGDKISFSVTSDFGEIAYAGTIKGDDMHLTLTAGGGQFTLEIAAKRAKTIDAAAGASRMIGLYNSEGAQ